MTRIVVISVDYDGCFDILCNLPNGNFHVNVLPTMPMRDYCARQKILEDRIQAVARNADQVFMYCGSNRQSTKIDKHLATRNQSGEALKELPILAAKIGFKFIPTILANDQDQIIDPDTGEVLDQLSLHYLLLNNVIKIRLVQKQIDEISARFPTIIIDYYFFDDDAQDQIFSAIRSAIFVPSNIRIHLIKHHWTRGIYQNHGIIAPFVAPASRLADHILRPILTLSVKPVGLIVVDSNTPSSTPTKYPDLDKELQEFELIAHEEIPAVTGKRM